jgi:catechol 2,3-dioxygenase-like lactoylglutathione lyase family enzyme
VITGVHSLIYSRNATAFQAFFRDVLGLSEVDAGGGWPIFALPPTELAIHPDEGATRHELWLMCDDVEATITQLAKSGVTADPVVEQRWGLTTTIRIPSGEELGLYEPKHPTAIRTTAPPPVA